MTSGYVRIIAGLAIVILLASTGTEAASLLEFDFESFVNGQQVGGPSYAKPEISAQWSTFNNGAETWGTLGVHSLTRWFGITNGQEVAPSAVFTTTESIRLDSVSFAHEHNHNPGFPTFGGYDVMLQLDSGAGYQTLATFRAASDGSGWVPQEITLPASPVLAPGTYQMRWYPVVSSFQFGTNSNTEYFGLDNVVLDGQVLYSAPAAPVPPTTELEFVPSVPSGWASVYDIAFVNGALVIELDIKLTGTVPSAVLDPLKARWEAGIEGIWSNAFEFTDGVFTYPLQLNVNWVTSDQDYKVHVTDGQGRPSMQSWFTHLPSDYGTNGSDPDLYQEEVAAHEIGHMLALYDEYLPDGALEDPSVPFRVTSGSIMADLGPPREWHFETIMQWLAGEIDRDLSFAQAPVPFPQDPPIAHFSDRHPALPEPGAGVTLGLGLVALLVLVRHRRGALRRAA